jgi:hypothetical protein
MWPGCRQDRQCSTPKPSNAARPHTPTTRLPSHKLLLQTLRGRAGRQHGSAREGGSSAALPRWQPPGTMALTNLVLALWATHINQGQEPPKSTVNNNNLKPAFAAGSCTPCVQDLWAVLVVCDHVGAAVPEHVFVGSCCRAASSPKHCSRGQQARLPGMGRRSRPPLLQERWPAPFLALRCSW